MALTSTEEALVRQLLDQQAAILSLAGNEATITSKLGATKVTLADLVAASSLADADLLLTRQGTTDKSVRADIIATYMASELGTLFAPIANPTFTGDPKAPTPPQFDNDTSLATTQFVQRALGSFSGVETYSSAATLTVADVGKAILATGTFTLTLPLASACPAGSVIQVFCNSGATTVSRQGSDTLQGVGSAVSQTLRVGDTITLRSNGVSSWLAFGGSTQLGVSAAFGKSLIGNGYQNLPSGLIIQWAAGANTAPAGNQTITLPLTFPNAHLKTLVSSHYATSAQNGGYGFISATTSQVTVARNNADNGNGVTPLILSIGY